MNTKKLKKSLAVILAVISLTVLTPIKADAEWKQDDRGWWYTEENSWAVGWRLIDGEWYYFDKYGYMVEDSYIDNCYYVGRNGAWKHLDYSDSNAKYNEFLQRLNQIEKEDREAKENAVTTMECVDYSKEFNEKYDPLLNDIYNYLKENMSEKEYAQLQSEELEWVNRKEDEINRNLEMFKGGSICGYVGGFTALKYTHERIYDLLQYMN